MTVLLLPLLPVTVEPKNHYLLYFSLALSTLMGN